MTPVLDMPRIEDVPLAYWRNNVVAFVDRCLVNPDTGEPFVLLPAEKLFLAFMFTFDADGYLRHPTLVYSAIKKSGKTVFGAIVIIVTVVLFAGHNAEAYCVANDLEQATSKVFEMTRRIIEASPMLRRGAKVSASRILMTTTNASIVPLASDYASAAGGHPTISVFDELWGFSTERARRLWDELCPVPTRKVSCRLVVTHAGFAGESALLEELYNRGLAQPEVGPDMRAGDGILMHWSHLPIAPWQDERWLAEMRRTHRPNQYLRMIENRFVTSESRFIDLVDWDANVNPDATPILSDRSFPTVVGVDASKNNDSTGIVACTFDRKSQRVRLVTHKVFYPSKDNPLDFEGCIEETLLDLHRRFLVVKILCDPWQMTAVVQRLAKKGLRIEEFPQTVPNLTRASQNLYELVNGRNLMLYPSAEMRLAISRAVAVESPRGWRISKEKSSHKIDVVVALGMACLAAMTNQSTYMGGLGQEGVYDFDGFFRDDGPPGPPPLVTDEASDRYWNRWKYTRFKND